MKDQLSIIARDLRDAIPRDLRAAAMDWAARRLEALAQSIQPGEANVPHPTGPAHEMGDAVCAPPGVSNDTYHAHHMLHAEGGRIGDWMQTVSGKQFWPLDPRPEEIDINDIAAALAKQCRFGGHCDWHYSVAQHSVYVSHQVPPEFQLDALMHDSTEAYCIDVPRPLKRSLIGYAKIEDRIWMAIATKFGLSLRLHHCIHEADESVLLAEKAQVMRPGPAWTLDTKAKPANIKVSQWTPDMAREAFISRFEVLVLQRSHLLAQRGAQIPQPV